MTGRRWGRAGVPLSPAEVEARARSIRAAANRSAARRSEQEAVARHAWERGLIKPYNITAALNLRGLEGPDVDAACLAEEPDVDDWEAGWKYPTFEQLLALAALTEFPPSYFAIDRTRLILHADETSLRFHLPLAELKRSPIVARFAPAAIRQRIPDYLPGRPELA